MTARTELTEKFDLPSVQLPELKPLQQSFAADAAENDLRNLLIDLFRDMLADQTYDVNVSGAMHLGSFDLVRRAVNADGLSLMQGDRSESAVRYLYRAWRARNRNGRGLFFLKTYLQLLFPNLCQVAQLWQDKSAEYPHGLRSVLDYNDDGTHFVPDPSRYWLTSRIEIGLDLSITTRSITTLTDIFRSIVPARLVPQFRFWLRFDAVLDITAEKALYMNKLVQVQFPWAGYRIMHKDDPGVWNLGTDADQGYYIRLGGAPIEFVTSSSKAVDIYYPWPELRVCPAGDADVWYLGTDGETTYKHRIEGKKINFTVTVTKA